MNCLVCGYQDASTLCPRCGTDLRLLAGEAGEARLEIAHVGHAASVSEDRADRKAPKRSG